MKALVERDGDLARRMMDFDRQINRLEMEVDDLCLRILARRQPVASDLRFITTALKLVTDLERIGDLGVNICERVIELNTEPPLRPYVDLPKMAETALGMVREALDAFVADDPERAQQVIGRDRVVDAYYTQLFRELLTYMMENPRNIFRATRIQSIAKYLERIGDHATNLAEMVVFMVRGKDIRHRWTTDDSQPAQKPKSVLFACVQNAARSQMAEAIARKLLPPTVACYSAGSQPATEVNPFAERVLREIGLDLASHKPKPFQDVPVDSVDVVVSLCADAPFLRLRHDQGLERWDIKDPTQVTGSEESTLAAFRDARDEIRGRIEEMVSRL
jgi:phosphate transport system protein